MPSSKRKTIIGFVLLTLTLTQFFGGGPGRGPGRSRLGYYTQYLKEFDEKTNTTTTTATTTATSTTATIDARKWWDGIWERKLENIQTITTKTYRQQQQQQQQQQRNGSSSLVVGVVDQLENSFALLNNKRKTPDYDNNRTYFEQVQSLFVKFPEPIVTKTIELYNGGKARDELIYSLLSLLQQQQQQVKKKNFTICALGGSSTGGTGAPVLRNRYYTRLGQYLSELLLPLPEEEEEEEEKEKVGDNNNNNLINIEVINRGHGSRNTLHGTNLLDNFVPQGTDLLIWEFAINDYWHEFEKVPNLSYEDKMNIERQALIAFLHEVGGMEPKPPKVILLYFWSATHFQYNKDGTVFNPVYDSHLGVGSQFDFVIGHVHVSSYIDELNLSSCIPEGLKHHSCLFLGDRCHPNNAGNLAATFLMLSLLRGKGQWSVIDDGNNSNDDGTNNNINSSPVKDNSTATTTTTTTTTTLPLTRPKYEWDCGTDTEEKRIIKSLVTDDAITGWKRKLGSWTANTPVNDVVKAPSRQLVLGREANITMQGKGYDYRVDRQYVVTLKKCTDDASDDELYLVAPVRPMIGAKAIGFALSSKVNNIRLTINSDKIATPGRFIFVPKWHYHEWPCHWVTQWGKSPGPEAMSWFVFEKEQESISSLSLCISNSTKTGVKISTLWVY